MENFKKRVSIYNVDKDSLIITNTMIEKSIDFPPQGIVYISYKEVISCIGLVSFLE